MQKILGYSFKNPLLLKLALTHTSFANENKDQITEHNQRLEFLGDSVLSIVVSEFIYENYPKLPEGELTKIRAEVVCEKSLMLCAKDIKLGGLIFLGKGEERTGGRNRASILSDTFEAVLGAIYLDGGLEKVINVILNVLKERIEEAASHSGVQDYKTTLQELVQKTQGNTIEYKTVDEKGPDHDREYVIEVLINDKKYGQGVGHSKKEAEQMAAKEGIKKW